MSTDCRIPPDLATCLGTLGPATEVPALEDAAIREAFRHSVGPDGEPARGIGDIVRPGASVCVVVSDHTRRTAADRVLPLLLEELAGRGCRRTDVFLLVASGIHRPPTPSEQRVIVGDAIYREFSGRIFLHDADEAEELVAVGTTARGHEVRVNRRVIEADHSILLGAATYHYHAGFGGGRKSLVPGLAARLTIRHNHSLTLDPDADRVHPRVGPGILAGNPVAEEMLESARMCRPAFTINTVVGAGGALVGISCGDLQSAHLAVCRVVEDTQRVELKTTADFVIADAGNARDWIQSHKALYSASRAVGPDGWIVLHAPCPEGLGNDRFRYWIRKPDLGEIFSGLRESPEVLGQTALSTRMRAPRTILISDLPTGDLEDLGMEAAADVQSAVTRVLTRLRTERGALPCYYAMPDARHCMPFTQ